MQLSRVFVLATTLFLAGLCAAQPPEPPKKETNDEIIARLEKEHKERAIKDYKEQLSNKFKLSDDAITSLQLLVSRQDAELRLVRQALYQVTLAEDPKSETSDEDYAVFWNDFQTLLGRLRAQRAKDSAQLSQQFDLDNNLRLKSFLTQRGIIGDELALSQPVSERIVGARMLSYYLKKEAGADKPKRVVPENQKPQ